MPFLPPNQQCQSTEGIYFFSSLTKDKFPNGIYGQGYRCWFASKHLLAEVKFLTGDCVKLDEEHP